MGPAFVRKHLRAARTQIPSREDVRKTALPFESPMKATLGYGRVSYTATHLRLKMGETSKDSITLTLAMGSTRSISTLVLEEGDMDSMLNKKMFVIQGLKHGRHRGGLGTPSFDGFNQLRAR